METEGTAWAIRTEFLSIIYMEFIPSSFEKVGSLHVYLCLDHRYFNLLTPNVNYSGRTAPLTSKVAFYIFIQQI